MIVLALIVGAGIMIAQLSQDDFSAAPLYVLLVASYVVGAVYYSALHLGVKPVVAVWLLMIVDVALETAFIHFSGGTTSQFSLVFCLTIIAAAFLLQVPGGLGIAVFASLGYICYGLLEVKGVVTPRGLENTPANVPYGYLRTYMHVTLFFLVGAVGGYLAERTRLKGRQLQNAETELKRLKVDTNNILKNMSSGVLVVNSERKILAINPVAERILEVEEDHIQAIDVWDALGRSMPAFTQELVSALDADESRKRHEMTIEREGRRPIPLGISISQLIDNDGDKTGIVAVFQDLTEVRDMQEQVRKADRLAAIGQLSAGIAHEIRNPLASISGSIEMLSHELDLDGENRRLMELIVKESDRLDGIINDFLEFARLRPPTSDEVSVEGCLSDVAVLLSNNTGIDCSVSTEIDESCRDLLVRFDEEQMKQVFLNLGINACDAMVDGGVLTIRARLLVDRSLCISFDDEGPGIPDESRGLLFEPFYTTKEGGTGLGLAIANKIVEAHGGRIEVRNRREGGAEFSVIFKRSALLKRKSECSKTS
jgi:two-component system sensor histidine kinase PilS (NtrC family)